MLADVAERMPMPTRAEPVHHSLTAWFTPQLWLQLLMIVLSAAGAWFTTTGSLRSDLRSIKEWQGVQEKMLGEIRGQLPNREAMDGRIGRIEQDLKESEADLREARAANRELLAYVIALRMAIERRNPGTTPEPPGMRGVP